MTEDLSTVDDAQLARWAYGRAVTADQQARAELAAAELRRRAAAAREQADLADIERATAEAHALAIAKGQGDEASAEHPSPMSDTRDRHRRRMLATGIAGVTAAALAVGAGVIALSQANPDPLAIFERPENALDREWAHILAIYPETTFTAGPRVFHDDNGRVGIVARMSTVPDGRSTDWDAYCLSLRREAGDGSSSLDTACTYPARFEREGLAIIDRGSFDGDGFDAAEWGPTGAPRLEGGRQIEQPESSLSILDLLANHFVGFASDEIPVSIVDDTERLLMGPKLAPTATTIAGDDATVQLYLLAGENETAEPELCMHAAHPESEGASSCIPLSVYRDSGANGIFVELAVASQNWMVSIDGAGNVSAQEAQVAVPG